MDFDTPDNLEATRNEWESDMTDAQAYQEVQNAKLRADMKQRMKDFSKTLDLKRQEDRWMAMYNFLYRYNRSAKIALDAFNNDCKRIKNEQKEFNAKSSHMQYGLHFPQILWDALCIVDTEMQNFDKLDTENQKRLYRKLGRTFPMYWMPRV